MNDLFKVKAGKSSLPLEDERELIVKAQLGDGDAVWALLYQYRGALQKAAYRVRMAVRGMTTEQVADLQADLVLAAVEAVHAFDLDKFVRLSQTLPTALKHKAAEVSTALAIPRGTLALWFKIWRAADQDFEVAASQAPTLGMPSSTFKAIQHSLEYVGSEWVTVPWSASPPSPDEETYKLAWRALNSLTVSERNVILLAYGFNGDPKTDAEVALILEDTRGAVAKRRQQALTKMRTTLTSENGDNIAGGDQEPRAANLEVD